MKRIDKKHIMLKKKLVETDTGKSFKLPFQLPSGIQRLEICYHVMNKEHADIDFGLEDFKGYRGWSNTRKQRIIISRDYATPGYLKGELDAGTWNFIIGVFSVRQPCEVQIEITAYMEQATWYKGDLHMHTIHSDGAFTLKEVLENVKKEGLEFIALTDHNTFSQNRINPSDEDLVVIPGVELTTYKGHANCWGVKKPFSHFFYTGPDDEEQVMSYLKEAQNNGALVSMNHPFHKDQWLWDKEAFPFDYVEIINAGPSTGNRQAIDWWHGQLCKGRRIVAVGGSDVHRIDPIKWYGIPTTWVEATSYDRRGILVGIEKGRVCVATSTKAPRLDFSIGEQVMGETYYYEEKAIANDTCSVDQRASLKTDESIENRIIGAEHELTLTWKLEKSRQGVLYIISSHGRVEKVRTGESQTIGEIKVNREALFYRLEFYDTEEKELLAVTNPIYIRKK